VVVGGWVVVVVVVVVVVGECGDDDGADDSQSRERGCQILQKQIVHPRVHVSTFLRTKLASKARACTLSRYHSCSRQLAVDGLNVGL
jgi:hypothetical protein